MSYVWLIMKLAPGIVLFVLVLTVAMSGCLNPSQRVVVTVGPSATPAIEIVTPTPKPVVASPIVTNSNGVTTARGSGNQIIKGIQLGNGVYIVKWLGSGTFVDISLIDASGSGGANMSQGLPSGERLLAIDDSAVAPGDFTLMVASDSSWAIDISRPDTSSPSPLPVEVSCSEQVGAISRPFRAQGGDLWIRYTLSKAPYGTGRVDIYNVYTGQSFYTRPIDAKIGQSMASAPAEGIYIAQVTLPGGSSYGDITISQQGV